MNSDDALRTPRDECEFANGLVKNWLKIFNKHANTYDCGSFGAEAAVRELCSYWDSHTWEGWTIEHLIEEDGASMYDALDRFFTYLREQMRDYRAKKYGEQLAGRE